MSSRAQHQLFPGTKTYILMCHFLDICSGIINVFKHHHNNSEVNHLILKKKKILFYFFRLINYSNYFLMVF